eukprot:1365747-Amorphochlora_amoeboformis.AAC.2
MGQKRTGRTGAIPGSPRGRVRPESSETCRNRCGVPRAKAHSARCNRAAAPLTSGKPRCRVAMLFPRSSVDLKKFEYGDATETQKSRVPPNEYPMDL